ncbi:anti-sigma factor antagonist [Sesbania bispinosa]|nr:anti-sigma factor antagonist [Sesbania bispinosa]
MASDMGLPLCGMTENHHNEAILPLLPISSQQRLFSFFDCGSTFSLHNIHNTTIMEGLRTNEEARELQRQ